MPGLTAPPGACDVVSGVFGAPDGARALLPPAATPLQQRLPAVNTDTRPVLHVYVCQCAHKLDTSLMQCSLPASILIMQT